MAGIAGMGKFGAMKQMAEKMGPKKPMKGKMPMKGKKVQVHEDMGALAAFAGKKGKGRKGY